MGGALGGGLPEGVALEGGPEWSETSPTVPAARARTPARTPAPEERVLSFSTEPCSDASEADQRLAHASIASVARSSAVSAGPCCTPWRLPHCSPLKPYFPCFCCPGRVCFHREGVSLPPVLLVFALVLVSGVDQGWKAHPN